MSRVKFPIFMDPPERHPFGSPEWAGRISVRVRDEFDTVESMGIPRLIKTLRTAIPGRPWTAWPPEEPWGDREVWCRRLFEVSWRNVVAMIAEVHPEEARKLETLAAEEDEENAEEHGGRREGAGRPPTRDEAAAAEHAAARSERRKEDENQGYIVTLKKRGNSRRYLLQRLQEKAAGGDKEARQALDGYKAGILRSARAAALVAGIVKPPDGLARLERAWKAATPEQRSAFLAKVRVPSDDQAA